MPIESWTIQFDCVATNGYLHSFLYTGKDNLERHPPSEELTPEDFVQCPHCNYHFPLVPCL